MSLAILPTTAAVYAGKQQQFSASGGTAPYVFSVLSGGGSIGSSSGLYTAGTSSGQDVIRVTDSLAAHADSVVTVHTALTLLCDIIAVEMGLSSNQVYLWDQKVDLPTDFALYVAVGVLSCKPFGNSRQLIPDGSSELLSVNMQATCSIDLISRGPDARDRKEEVILALRSIYSQQQQERFGFYISALSSSFVNLSEIDGSAIPYRFNIGLNIQYQVSKTKAVPYFTTFTDAVVTDAPVIGG